MGNFTFKRLFLLASLILSFTISNAQITIVASDFTEQLQLGKQVTTYLDTVTTELNVGSAGQFSLDYSNLVGHSTFVTESKDKASSPYASDFPDAEYASNYSGVFAGIQSNTWVYNSVGDDFLSYGTGTVAQTVAGNITTTITFSPAWVEYHLPINLNDQNTYTGTQTIETTSSIPGFGRTLEQDVEVTQNVDGYGTVLLPGNKQINVLRIIEVTTFTSQDPVSSSTVIKLFSNTGEIISITPADDQSISGTIAIDNVSWTSGDGGEVIVEAPSAPDQLATTVGTDVINLGWVDNSNNENGFYIEKKLSGGASSLVASGTKSAGADEFVRIDSVGADITTYADVDVVPGQEYTYRVQAYNENGSSAYSAETTAMIDIPDVSSPTGLSATLSDNSADLMWTDNADNEMGYYIERSEDSGDFMVIDSTAADATSYNNSGLSAGVEYTYRVRAYSEYTNSEYSNTASVRITPTGIDPAAYDSGIEILEQNYPNPFQTKTTISFALPTRERVSLVVINTNGKIINRMVDGVLDKGKHRMEFDASELESGSYYYQLRTAKTVETKSMLFVR